MTILCEAFRGMPRVLSQCHSSPGTGLIKWETPIDLQVLDAAQAAQAAKTPAAEVPEADLAEQEARSQHRTWRYEPSASAVHQSASSAQERDRDFQATASTAVQDSLLRRLPVRFKQSTVVAWLESRPAFVLHDWHMLHRALSKDLSTLRP